MQAFSQFVASRGLLSCGAWALGHVGFRSCACWALEGGLSSCGAQAQFPHGMWSLPRSGIKPVSPALADRFFTGETLVDFMPNYSLTFFQFITS